MKKWQLSPVFMNTCIVDKDKHASGAILGGEQQKQLVVEGLYIIKSVVILVVVHVRNNFVAATTT